MAPPLTHIIYVTSSFPKPNQVILLPKPTKLLLVFLWFSGDKIDLRMTLLS